MLGNGHTAIRSMVTLIKLRCSQLRRQIQKNHKGNELMKINLFITCLAILVWLLCGCSSIITQGTITCNYEWRNGPITEVSSLTAPTPGMVDLLIRASIKTHIEGFYPLESDSAHGKTEFPFVLVIDDMKFEWKDMGLREVLPWCDEKGNRVAEGGEGIRYSMERKFLLNPGLHRIILKLPTEKRAITVPVELTTDAVPYILEFRAVHSTPGSRTFGFMHGVTDLAAFLNGVPLQRCRE